VSTSHNRSPQTVSGYFDNPNKLEAATDSISQAKGIGIGLFRIDAVN
jgi:hypothetical protein